MYYRTVDKNVNIWWNCEVHVQYIALFFFCFALLISGVFCVHEADAEVTNKLRNLLEQPVVHAVSCDMKQDLEIRSVNKYIFINCLLNISNSRPTPITSTRFHFRFHIFIISYFDFIILLLC